VIVTFRIGWRRSYDYSTFCDQGIINSGQLIGINDYLICQDGCYGNVGSLLFRCTDFSVNEDWTIGTNSFQFTFPVPVMSPRYYQARLVVSLWRRAKPEIRGVLPENFGRGVRPASQNPYPNYDQNLRFSLPYLCPDQKFDTLFMTWLLDH